MTHPTGADEDCADDTYSNTGGSGGGGGGAGVPPPPVPALVQEAQSNEFEASTSAGASISFLGGPQITGYQATSGTDTYHYAETSNGITTGQREAHLSDLP